MTSAPWTIDAAQSLGAAHRMMLEHDIRHLPVLRGGHLVGIVSLRDLYLMETLEDVNIEEAHVEEAMRQDIFTVPPEAPLDEVAEVMGMRKLGCAIVAVHDRVEGIFTTIDAVLVLTWLLRGGDLAQPAVLPSGCQSGDFAG
jgi:acetoin utilization protein AcuB